jgi:hypothetical protein
MRLKSAGSIAAKLEGVGGEASLPQACVARLNRDVLGRLGRRSDGFRGFAQGILLARAPARGLGFDGGV